MSSRKGSSFLPIVIVAAAAVSGGTWFLFLRGPRAAETPAPPAAAAPPAPIRLVIKDEPAPEPPKKPAPARSAIADVQALVDAGKWRDARALVASKFAGPLSDADREAFAAKGIEVNQKLLVDAVDPQDIELYEVQQGDTLEGIARKFKALNGVKGSIMFVHNFRENTILRAGRKIKVAKGTWSIAVDKSLFKLWVLYDGAPYRTCTVAIGTDQKTPAGKFTVGTRNPKPAWWPPADFKRRGPIPYGDADNPLGEWWIALDHDMHHGLGIHGTNDPGSVGSKASNGCVRMRNEEVGAVAAVTFKGMSVEIFE